MLGWILALVIGWWPHPCAGDVNGDRIVNVLDASVIAGNWLQTVTPGTNGDLDLDGVVNLSDLVIVGANYGNICRPIVVPGLAVDG
ncbi:MAG: hypothetical protein EKK55_14300 [Rhodocyclaceae bacterium]|nr:MAG: hypothetical protein EKK55_14300 [Rhodocyclaceae bacterium]